MLLLEAFIHFKEVELNVWSRDPSMENNQASNFCELKLRRNFRGVALVGSI